MLLNNQDQGILSVSDLNDNVLYFVGTYESRSGAELRKQEMISKGFKDAYIVSSKKPVEVVNTEMYYPEGVYYRILLGRYAGEIPGEYATILLQTEDLLETEEDIVGNTYLLSTKISTMDGMEERLAEFSELGFEKMEIVSYYQYDAIPFAQAQSIKRGEPIGVLQKYDNHEGIDSDPFLYNKEAIYFYVEVGRFLKEIPADFTTLLFDNEDENILREETFDEELVFFTENIYTYEEAEKRMQDLKAKGFKNAKVVAFHKYTRIGVDKAIKILNSSEN